MNDNLKLPESYKNLRKELQIKWLEDHKKRHVAHRIKVSMKLMEVWGRYPNMSLIRLLEEINKCMNLVCGEGTSIEQILNDEVPTDCPPGLKISDDDLFLAALDVFIKYKGPELNIYSTMNELPVDRDKSNKLIDQLEACRQALREYLNKVPVEKMSLCEDWPS